MIVQIKRIVLSHFDEAHQGHVDYSCALNKVHGRENNHETLSILPGLVHSVLVQKVPGGQDSAISP